MFLSTSVVVYTAKKKTYTSSCQRNNNATPSERRNRGRKTSERLFFRRVKCLRSKKKKKLNLYRSLFRCLVCVDMTRGGTGCHNLIYFESITQKVLISPLFFVSYIFFLKDEGWRLLVQVLRIQVFRLTLGRVASREREKLSGKKREESKE